MNNTPTSIRMIKTISIVFFVCGLFLFIAFLYSAFSTIKFLNTAQYASGTIVETPYGKFHPLVEFRTNEGEMVRYYQGGLNNGYNAGDKATVLYKAEDTNEAVIDSFLTIWAGKLVFLSLVFVIVGIYKWNNPKTKYLRFTVER